MADRFEDKLNMLDCLKDERIMMPKMFSFTEVRELLKEQNQRVLSAIEKVKKHLELNKKHATKNKIMFDMGLATIKDIKKELGISETNNEQP